MMYTTSTSIHGESRGAAGTIYQWALKKGCERKGDVLKYLTTMHSLCTENNIRFEVVVAQSILETTDVKSGSPWASDWWISRCNPAGIGITGDASQDAASRNFKTGDASAKAHFAQLWLYTVGDELPIGLVTEDDPRWSAAISAGRTGIAPTISGLSGTWAADTEYATKIVNHLNALDDAGLLDIVTTPESSTSSPTKDTTVTKFSKYTFPGMKNPVYIPSWIIVEQKIIPSSVSGWTSGQNIPSSNFTSTTYHDTDNLSSNATSEYEWAKNGGRGEINSPGSYNGIFDGKRLIITQRFDELVGHAANPTGNVTSYAFEEAFGVDGHDAALEVGMWVHAGVLQAMGKSGGTESMYLHQFWSGKWCSRQILDRNQWSYVEKTVDQRVTEINAYLASGTVPQTPPVDPPVPTYKTPVKPVFFDALKDKNYKADGDTFWFKDNATYTVTNDTDQLLYAVSGSGLVGPKLKKNDTVKAIAKGQSKTDKKFYIIAENLARVNLDDLTLK